MHSSSYSCHRSLSRSVIPSRRHTCEEWIHLHPLLPSPQNIFETKAVARTFCPEFSHHFAIALPLGGGAKQVLAETLQQSKAVFEVWHKVDQTAPQVSWCHMTCM